ncbi:MAG TPA: flagellar protein export ATPase FliI [Rhodanobacteraceae bacterium]|nr:flagellar protein export ATPase FliI [Rhodanobacteraceae bacterium]
MTYALGQRWAAHLEDCAGRVRDAEVVCVEGQLLRVVGLTLEAHGLRVPVGSRCLVAAPGGRAVEVEVVGFARDSTFLMPIGTLDGAVPGAAVRPCRGGASIPVGAGLLGRVLDSSGSPIDGGGPLAAEASVPLRRTPINPMQRQPIHEPLDVGVRAINALLTVGRGQRLGLFAGSGVGKSTLLGMLTRFTDADVVVVGLIGERGREVREFVEGTLGVEGRRKAVIVVEPSDAPPLSRLRGAQVATAIAEHFRDRGQRVLLLMDSLTRYAQAQREIGLAIGEPPATKGYPPSVFAMLPALVERAGTGADGEGSITAFYTVLTEGDDHRHDPVADAARAILDGHVVLSRDLAEAGHFPAIDVEASVSRVLPAVAAPGQLALAERFRQVYATWREHRDLITIGAYRKGSDPRVDEAITLWPAMEKFLRQPTGESVPMARALHELAAVLPGVAAPVTP